MPHPNHPDDPTGERYAEMAALRDRIALLEKALRPFESGGEWDKIKAWIVNGAPTRAVAVEAARTLTQLQVAVDKALASAAPEEKEKTS